MALTGVVVVVVAACAPGEAAVTTTTVSVVATTASSIITTSTPAANATTTRLPDGYLMRLDPETMEPIPGLEPFVMDRDTWSQVSDDGSILLQMRWDGAGRATDARVIDVERWEDLGTFDVGYHTARLVYEGTFFGYDDRSGRGLFAVDLATGAESALAHWKHSLSFWDDLHVLSGGVIAGLGAAPSDVVDYVTHYSVYLHDPVSGERIIPVGPIDSANWHSGVFDGDYEIPIFDSPGVAWGDDRLFIVHAEELEVTEVDLTTGSVDTHQIDASSWLDRLLAFWMPAASAKGPSMGTYSSAALSPDGRYLFVSGNRSDVEIEADGSLVEVQEHLGLIVVDTETWELVESPELNIQFVRNAGGLILGIDTRVGKSVIHAYYLLEIDDGGALTYRGPFSTAGGWCDSTPDPTRLLCLQEGRAQLIEFETMQPVAELDIGYEDMVHGIGVLEDWVPSALP